MTKCTGSITHGSTTTATGSTARVADGLAIVVEFVHAFMIAYLK